MDVWDGCRIESHPGLRALSTPGKEELAELFQTGTSAARSAQDWALTCLLDPGCSQNSLQGTPRRVDLENMGVEGHVVRTSRWGL